MAIIYRIMVRCPATGKAIDSQIRTSGRETINGGLLEQGTVSCPHCHQLHSFSGNSYLDFGRITRVNSLWRPNR